MVLGFLPKAQQLSHRSIKPTIQKGLHLNIYKAVALGKLRASITLQPYQHLNVKKKRLPTFDHENLLVSRVLLDYSARLCNHFRWYRQQYLIVLCVLSTCSCVRYELTKSD